MSDIESNPVPKKAEEENPVSIEAEEEDSEFNTLSLYPALKVKDEVNFFDYHTDEDSVQEQLKGKVKIPKEPIMGGIEDAGGYYLVWTGGKPNNTWTGLEKNPDWVRSGQFRSNKTWPKNCLG